MDRSLAEPVRHGGSTGKESTLNSCLSQTPCANWEVGRLGKEPQRGIVWLGNPGTRRGVSGRCNS